MPTQEIPRDEWLPFLERYSRQHEGWLATLEVFGPEIGAQQEARDLPLEGITAASKDGNASTVSISISLGNTPDDHVTHTITDPTRLWLEQTSQGANAALEIESAGEVKTLLRFRSTVPAEMVDGVVLEKSSQDQETSSSRKPVEK
jgi:hypothetical protein